MHNHNEKYSARPGFEPGTPRLQAPVDTNEPSGKNGEKSRQTVKKILRQKCLSEGQIDMFKTTINVIGTNPRNSFILVDEFNMNLAEIL